jgi:hypothetical protein
VTAQGATFPSRTLCSPPFGRVGADNPAAVFDHQSQAAAQFFDNHSPGRTAPRTVAIVSGIKAWEGLGA